MARSLRQARQFIIHQHITLGEKKITSPSYLVPLSEENIIQFSQGSSFSDSAHPERIVVQKKGSKNAKSKEEENKISEHDKKKPEASPEVKPETKITKQKSKKSEKTG